MLESGRVLIFCPMPLWPASAGNRRRALEVVHFFKRQGFIVHAAITDHEDQIYRAFGRIPPTDLDYFSTLVDEIFYIESPDVARIRTTSKAFFIDDWFPERLETFCRWYSAHHGSPDAVIVNYVFYSKALEFFPATTKKIIDTHDCFADRNFSNKVSRSAPNFFYTSVAEEGKGLRRADLAIGIQELETARLQTHAGGTKVLTLNHRAQEHAAAAATALNTFGFIGHGNDANVVSISKFAHEWAARFREPSGPFLLIAGEVSQIFAGIELQNVRVLGYVDALDDFYDAVDAIVAPVLFGTGLKIKVVEALARQKIIFGTATAFEGLFSSSPLHTAKDASSILDDIDRVMNDEGAIAAAFAASETVYARYREGITVQENALLAEIPRSLDRSPSPHLAKGDHPARAFYAVIDDVAVVVEIKPMSTARFTGPDRQGIAAGDLIALESVLSGHRLSVRENDFSAVRAHITLINMSKAPSLAGLDVVTFEELSAFVAKHRFLSFLSSAALNRHASGKPKLLFMLAQLFEASLNWWSAGIMRHLENDLFDILTHAPTQLLKATAATSAFLLEICGEQKEQSVEGSMFIPSDFVDCRPLSDPALMSGMSPLQQIYRSQVSSHLIPLRLRIRVGQTRSRLPDGWSLSCKIGATVGRITSTQSSEEETALQLDDVLRQKVWG